MLIFCLFLLNIVRHTEGEMIGGQLKESTGLFFGLFLTMLNVTATTTEKNAQV